MDENLVGYLLKALDPHAQREVETHVRKTPEAQRQLDHLRLALEPLAADHDDPEPPPELWARTLGAVAAYKCRDLPFTAPPKAPRVGGDGPILRGWWRRADVLIAASILLVVASLVPNILGRFRQQSAVTECQNNLRQYFASLQNYSDLNAGAFPKIEAEPPRNFAGAFVALLQEKGPLPDNLNVNCPSQGVAAPQRVSLGRLEDLYVNHRQEFEHYAAGLGGGYAYNIGYLDGNKLHGLRRDLGQLNNEYLPVMADRPPFDQRNGASLQGNSLNHHREGQNVLYLGGNVRFCTSRHVGVSGDDIFVNKHDRLAAGVNQFDSVLGASPVRPYPPQAED